MKSSYQGKNFDFNVLPVNEYIVGDVRPVLLALLVAVALVLLIAAANVANLALVRTAARVKEISIRTTLGACRVRIVRQLLTESLLLAFVGGLLGILLAFWGVDFLLKLAPENLPRLEHVRIDARVLGWTALISLLTGVVFGLAPAWQSSRLNINQTLKEGGRGACDGRSSRRWRNLLVVSELSLAVLLLVGAGLLVKSLWRLMHVETGVNTERVLTMQILLSGQRYADQKQIDAFYPRLLERVASLPGVRAAAFSNSLPPDNPDFSDDFAIEGRPLDPNQTLPVAYVIRVSLDYFHLLGISLRRGRYFSDTDSADAPRVAIINETLARQLFLHEDPIGKRINMNDVGAPAWCQIIGVVSDVKYNGLANQIQPALYQPLSQATSDGGALIIKTDVADPLSLTESVRNQVKSLDSELPITQVRTLDQIMTAAAAQLRFRTTLISLFAGLALILACIGIYGVISYSVQQRTREIGLRIALGAQRADVLRMVMKQGAMLTGVGILIGLGAAASLTWLMKALLFDVKATDPLTFVIASLLLTGVSMLACWLPARRAINVDPMVALKYE